MRKIIRRCLLFAVLVFGIVPTAVFAGEETHVVILGTSDMHGNICSWSYEDNAETDNNGIAHPPELPDASGNRSAATPDSRRH